MKWSTLEALRKTQWRTHWCCLLFVKSDFFFLVLLKAKCLFYWMGTSSCLHFSDMADSDFLCLKRCLSTFSVPADPSETGLPWTSFSRSDLRPQVYNGVLTTYLRKRAFNCGSLYRSLMWIIKFYAGNVFSCWQFEFKGKQARKEALSVLLNQCWIEYLKSLTRCLLSWTFIIFLES